MISGSPIMGGAEIASRRIALALASCGCEVIFISLVRTPIIHSRIVHIIIKYEKNQEFLFKVLKKTSYPLSFYFSTRYFFDKVKTIIIKEKPDIINIHNIKQAFWSSDFVAWCSRLIPTIWTLHDMSSFTGRCVYTFECEQFLCGCNNCPRINIPIICSKKFIHTQWNKNRYNIVSNKNLYAVTPSNWLKSQATRGFWEEKQIMVIPNCINLTEYYPRDTIKSKKELGIFDSNQTILLTSHDLNEKRKGIGAIIESLSNNHPEAKISFILMGNGDKIKGLKHKFPVYHLGYISKELMPIVYSAADLLVHPSIADNLPNVIMESLSVGTPVIGFNIGGIPEMIIPEKTGWLVEDINYELMSDKILEALTIIKKDPLIIQNACRSYAEENYAEKIIGSKYMRLYNSLIS